MGLSRRPFAEAEVAFPPARIAQNTAYVSPVIRALRGRGSQASTGGRCGGLSCDSGYGAAGESADPAEESAQAGIGNESAPAELLSAGDLCLPQVRDCTAGARPFSCARTNKRWINVDDIKSLPSI